MLLNAFVCVNYYLFNCIFETKDAILRQNIYGMPILFHIRSLSFKYIKCGLDNGEAMNPFHEIKIKIL